MDDEEEDERPSFGFGKRRKQENSNDNDNDGGNDYEEKPASFSRGGSRVVEPPQTSGKPGFGEKMLMKMGYKGTGGLGKEEQGIAEPVKGKVLIGQQGLGFEGAFTHQTHDYEEEKIEVRIKPQWLTSPAPTPDWKGKCNGHGVPTNFDGWIRSGLPDESITNPQFCDLDLQNEIFDCKSGFDEMDGKTFSGARLRANPFEKIQKEMFQNRAALKVAELDAITDRLLTVPHFLKGKRQLLYYADICAGPGGFSEYMLTVMKWRAKAFGFTLKGNNDFQLRKFNSNAPCHSFLAYYGRDNSGDITQSDNIRHFADKVWSEEATKGGGLHLVIGDGGFSVEGQENKQEFLSRQLVLCQALMGMATLRKGGTFLCKLFDSFLPFTVDVLAILHMHFEKFAIVKPNQSRPANSERYVIAVGYKQAKPPVLEFLYSMNDKMNSPESVRYTPTDPAHINKSSYKDKDNNKRGGGGGGSHSSSSSSSSSEKKKDWTGDPNKEQIISFVDPSWYSMQQPGREFTAYMRLRNTQIGKSQVRALQRLKRYIEDPNLPSDDQDDIRLQSLAFWDLSENGRADPSKEHTKHLAPKYGKPQIERRVYFQPEWGKQLFVDPEDQKGGGLFQPQGEDLYRNFICMEMTAPLREDLKPSTHPHFGKQIELMKNPEQWRCFLLPPGQRCYVMSGPKGVMFTKPDGSIKPLGIRDMVLPGDTVLDVVFSTTNNRFHILDAWCLPSNNPSDLHFWKTRPRWVDRQEMISMWLDSISHTCPFLRYSAPSTLPDLLTRPPDPAMDLHFVRVEGVKPSPCRMWRVEQSKDFPLKDVLDFVKKVLSVSKQQRPPAAPKK